MQQIASISSNGAPITYDNGGFAVGGAAVGIEEVMAYEKSGVIVWMNEETRSWAHALASSIAVSQPATARRATGGSAEPKKPFYKKSWVWAMAAVLILGALAGNSGGPS